MPMIDDPDMVHVMACKFYMHAVAMHSCPVALRNPCTDHVLEKAVASTVHVPCVSSFCFNEQVRAT